MNSMQGGASLRLVSAPDSAPAVRAAGRLPLLAAAARGFEEWSRFAVSDLIVDRRLRAAAVLRWQHLRGASARSPEGNEAKEAVLSDATLLVALCAPAQRFVAWFEAEDWTAWPESDEGGDQWAHDVLARAKTATAAMGALRAAAMPLAPPDLPSLVPQVAPRLA